MDMKQALGWFGTKTAIAKALGVRPRSLVVLRGKDGLREPVGTFRD